MRKLLNLPLAAIGRLFDRDHSTVISSIKQVEKALISNQDPFTEVNPLSSEGFEL